MDSMQRLVQWWRAQCDGEWEHEFGITIETMDNPGLLVKIDLSYTNADVQSFEPISERRSDTDWCECTIARGSARGSTEDDLEHFVGMGGPGNLNEVLERFLRLLNVD